MVINHSTAHIPNDIVASADWNANHTGTLNHGTELTNVTSDQHHAQIHTAASHSDIASTGAEIDGAVGTSHARQHAITTAADHTSTATPAQMLKADANGLPIDATNTDAQVSATVTASHAAGSDNQVAGDFAHNSLSGLNDGTDYEHITATQVAALHGVNDTNSTYTNLMNDSMADALHRHSELSASDGSPDPALSVDANGNVGIGTTNPTGNLDVSGAFSRITVTDTGGDNRYALNIDAPQSGWQYASINAYKYGTGAGAVKLILNESGGNVGIGTTSPASKLSINGGLHVGGDSDAGDNNILVDGTITIGSTTLTEQNIIDLLALLA